eukprot:scaffold204321_cov30-Tisochrysis_lutea.AAC.3
MAVGQMRCVEREAAEMRRVGQIVAKDGRQVGAERGSSIGYAVRRVCGVGRDKIEPDRQLAQSRATPQDGAQLLGCADDQVKHLECGRVALTDHTRQFVG